MVKFFILTLLSCLTFHSLQATEQTVIGKAIAPFTAPNAQGGEFSFSQFPNAKAIAIVFTCNHCPFAELYIERMNQFHRMYEPLGIPLIAVNPMDSTIYEEETLSEMRAKVLRDSIVFPYLQDHSQSIGRMFKAAYTPQVFIIQKYAGNWNIVYQGIIDDNGRYPELATSHLKNTADAILSGKQIPQEMIDSFGCKIIYRSQ